MIVLVLNIYSDPDPARQAEIDAAYEINRDAFDQLVVVDGRPTFAEMFERANDMTEYPSVIVMANSDISFNATIRQAENMAPDECWCLTRWENGKLGGGRDSFDSFVFKGPIKPELIAAAEFLPGIPGCDNALAYRAQKAGCRVSNPSLSIVTNHHHASGVRHYDKQTKRVERPHLMITPHKLGETPKIELA